MIFRFSLYGFLKNQQYYEPFLFLVFLEKGLSFFEIGILIGFREICINLFEVPSGAVADLYGRRRAMIYSFMFYILSFIIFAVGNLYWQFFPAMLFFAAGEAFRTGTHKAMIFEWLRLNNRLHERTRVYGYTRSWSKIGSALSALIAGGLVFHTGRFSSIFLYAIIPYCLNIINFLGYPKALDGEKHPDVTVKHTFIELWKTLKYAFSHSTLRRTFLESMGFEGFYRTSKDYLQPILKSLAIGLPLLLALNDKERTALLVAFVYFILFILSSIASRHSHWLCDLKKGEEGAARLIWKLNGMVFLILIPLFVYDLFHVAALGFVLLVVLQNFWRPILISRVDKSSDSRMGATVLSMESQAKSLFTMVCAPVLGLCVDHLGFWTVGLFGFGISLGMVMTNRDGK